MSYHLPPPTDHRSPQSKSPPSDHLLPSNILPRRPLTPSSLRDVNLSPNNTVRDFNYPSPPTGHDLMAMFPPNPPITFLPGPTSGFFHSQEKAFFSRAGDNSLVRVQIDIDMPMQPEMNKGKTRALPVTVTHRHPPWTPPSSSPPHPAQQQQQHRHSLQPPPPPVSHHRSQTIPINTIPVGPPQHPHRLHKLHINTPPDIKLKPSESTMIMIDGSDESWKKATPHSERRRAGKQPKRRSDG